MNPQLQGILGWWQAESQGTIRMIQAIPADHLDTKVHEKIRTLRELADHLAGTMRDLAESVETGKAVFGAAGSSADTPAGIAADYKAIVEDAMKRIEELTDEQLNAHIPFEMNGEVMWNPTAMEMVSGYIAHEIHHRAQMSVILRQVGAKVPGMYGPTSDGM